MREAVCCMQRRGVRALALQHLFANEGSHDRPFLKFFCRLMQCCNISGSVWDPESRHQTRLQAWRQLVNPRISSHSQAFVP